MKKIFYLLAIFIFSASVVLAEDPPPDQKFQGFNLQGFSENGDKSWDVKGDTANVQGSDIELSNVNANSYGEQKVNVTAERGQINQISGKMHLEKDVIITSEDGQQLFTDSLDWDRDADTVSTKDDVIIADDMFTATGRGMDAKPGLKSAKIHENVTVMVDAEEAKVDGDPVTITSDGPMTIDQANSKAVFVDNVVAIQLDRTLKADKMEIYFNEGMNDIEKMICTGNVEMIQGENRSYAQKATYTAALQKLVLSGRPKLIMHTESDLFNQ